MSWIPSYKKKLAPYVVPNWSDGTDAQIVEALEKHYAGEVDLTEYWSVGDERVMHLNAMQAPNPNSSSTWDAQDVTAVIIAMNHTDLAIPINGHDKAVITVQTKEVLSGSATANSSIYLTGVSNASKTTFTKWKNSYIRTYLNNVIYASFSSDAFKSAIKSSSHYRHTTYNGDTSELMTDYLFIPSYTEVFLTTDSSQSVYYSSTSPSEGDRFEYYQTSANTLKYFKNDISAARHWWLSSPDRQYNSGYYWIYISNSTAGKCFRLEINQASYLAPAWAM